MGFASFHPLVTFAWFACAIVLVVVAAHPMWAGMALAASAACCLMIRGRGGWKLIAGMAAAFVVLSFANGLFNARGSTVLFSWLGRPYTLEALCYGMQTAAMFVCMMLLFGSFDRVMTTDRITYLFGKRASSITLVLTMAMRSVPRYVRQAKEFDRARSGIGEGASGGTIEQRIRSGLSILGALVTWALESGITTADSMRSRGYGVAPMRTRIMCFRFNVRDACLLAVMAIFAGAAAFGIAQGAADAEWFPHVNLPEATMMGFISLCAFSCFMLIPFAIEVGRRASWRSSISRI